MNIACVHLGLCRALSGLGHTVLELRPPAGLVRIIPLLGDFRPDLLIQQETLGPRTLIADLPALGCPKVFWSIDTHLNSFWHQYYARFFDLLCTTQKHWLPLLTQLGVSRSLWLPWHGAERRRASWAQRREGMAFAGRLTPERPVRGWFVGWLKELGEVHVRQDLGFADMLDFYDQSRLVPNESIFGEVNFRLFEAASCGCAVLNPAIPGLEDLFEPGEEVAVYRDGAELAAWVKRLQGDGLLARSMGLRAWERVRREHLPRHRAETLLEAVQGLPLEAASGPAGDVAWWLTLHQLRESGRLAMDDAAMARGVAGLPVTGEVLAVRLRLKAGEGRDEFLRLALPVVQTGQYEACQDVNLAGSMGALRFGDCALARLFFLRSLRHGASAVSDPGHTALSICLAWARELQRTGRISRPGFAFDPTKHLPDSALECLVLASESAPDNAGVYREMASLLARDSGWDGLRLKALSWLSLRDRGNWRLGLELGVTDCRAFRVRQGLEEITAARHEAARQGQEERFLRALAARDESGSIGAMLGPGPVPATNSADE
jgi:hypothetical protein